MINLLGFVSGQLTVIAYGYAKRGPASKRGFYHFWKCSCSCGKEHLVEGAHIRRERIKSCGCLLGEKSELLKQYSRSTKRGVSKEYKSWQHAKERCFSTKDKSFKNYGGRGIIMCPQWVSSFEAFIKHMGPCPEGLTLDRIDYNGNYEPGNCRWADWTTQNNNRRSTKLSAYDKKMVFDWYKTGEFSQNTLARQFNVSQGRIWGIINDFNGTKRKERRISEKRNG